MDIEIMEPIIKHLIFRGEKLKFEEQNPNILENAINFYLGRNKEIKSKKVVRQVGFNHSNGFVQRTLYEKYNVKILADERGVEISGLTFSYETLRNLRNFLRSKGEFEWLNEEIKFNCAWCGRSYQRNFSDVYRRSVNSIRYCSDKCKIRVTNLKSHLRTISRKTGSSVLKVEEIARGLHDLSTSRPSVVKLKEYLLRLDNVEAIGEDKYKISDIKKNYPKSYRDL